MQAYIATASIERQKLLAAHALLTSHLSKEELRRRGRRGGSSLIPGELTPQWRVPRECMVKLWEIANGAPPEGWEDPLEEAEGVPRPKSAPPCEGWERVDMSLEPLDADKCHPVPAGVSSSALHGGSGGASRVLVGYDPGNDMPLLADTLLSLEETRPPNVSAVRAGEFQDAWDASNWDFAAASNKAAAQNTKRLKAAARRKKEERKKEKDMGLVPDE